MSRSNWHKQKATFPLPIMTSRASMAASRLGLRLALHRKGPILLTSHAMSAHIYKEGLPVALKPDAEYPEWLFQMYFGPCKKLKGLDLETPEYWRLLWRQTTQQWNKLCKTRPF
uniref:Large ribosomal subunit protein mL54 n=1 Tax=Anolis carolinensis TaxID=28377 RepID=A0A803T0Z7_ANOCA